MESRAVASRPRSTWIVVPLREFRFWVGICLVLMGAPDISYARNASTITVTNSAGQFKSVAQYTQREHHHWIFGLRQVNGSLRKADGQPDRQWSQTKTDSQTVTLSKTETTVTQVFGPASSKDGIDHDEDIVHIWLNPEVSLTFVQNIGVITNGYFADPDDPVLGMDVVTLTVKQLKNPALISADVQNRLNRPWDPAGGALNANDYLDILETDPYATNPTFDPRFDSSGRYSDTGVIINYEPTDGSGQPTSTQYSVASPPVTRLTVAAIRLPR